MKKIDLLRRAGANLDQILYNIERSSEDVVYLDIAAYHLQQAVEKLLKHCVVVEGRSYKETHDILRLCNQMVTFGVRFPDWVFINAKTLTKYMTNFECEDSSVGDKREIYELYRLTKNWIDEIKSRECK